MYDTDVTDSVVLQNKMTPPRVTDTQLDRSDILVSALAECPVVMMMAPAGYGKTSVLASAAQVLASTQDVVWYQCDRYDTSPVLFLRACERALGLSTGIGTPQNNSASAPNELEAISRLLDGIRDRATPVVMILDDISHVRYSESQAFIRLLVRYRPANLRLVFSGRFLPFYSGHLQLDPAIRWLGRKELAFSESEFAEYLHAAKLMLREEAQAPLLRVTGGWPAGLALWLMAWRSVGMPEHWSSELGIREVSDYLNGEVISGLNDELRTLLLTAASLGTFNDALLTEMLPQSEEGSQSLLFRQLYLQEIPGKPEWYRMEPLIARCLSRLVNTAQREALHQQAYHWFRDRGDAVASLYHAGQAGESNDSHLWLAEQTDTILAGLDISGLSTWFANLNDDQLYASPQLMAVAAWTDLLAGRLEAAEGMIERLDHHQGAVPTEIIALQGYLAGARGELARAERLCQQALDNLPGERFTLRFLVTSMLASLAMAHRDPDGSRLWNRYALDIARKARQPALEAMAHLDHARIEFNRGHVSRCLKVLTQGQEVLEANAQSPDSMAHGRLMILKATVGWITGMSDEPTDKSITRAAVLCEEASDPAAAYGYAIRALNLMGQGHYTQALSVLDAGERNLQARQVSFTVYAWLHTVRSNIWISQKKYRRAHECLSALLEDADSAGVARCEYSALLPGFSTLSLSRLYLMSGQHDACLALTDSWLKHTPNGFMSVFIRLMRAGALAMKQETAESVRQMDIVRRSFRTEGVSKQLQNWLPGLVSFLNIPNTSEQTDSQPAVALSDRERDVLKLMAKGLSNQDIAEQLFISLHTVKTHARKVNVKLGTRSRTQAIHRAKELMII